MIDMCFQFTAALEVTGHEAPLIVGLSGELTCSTHLDVAKLEWYLVGFEDSLEEVDNTTLSIDVDVYSTALDGNEFTCRGTTVGGMVFEETVTIIVKGLAAEAHACVVVGSKSYHCHS